MVSHDLKSPLRTIDISKLAHARQPWDDEWANHEVST
jgi:hypothetical protein